MATPLDFAALLLNRFSMPRTQNRLVSLVAFAAIEGGHWHNTARFNPMNTMRDAPGAVQAPGLLGGIKAYPDWRTGIEATALTMVQGNMRPIIDALKTDASPREFLSAVTRSAWCPGCDYTPFDPYALYQAHANESDQGEALAVAGAAKGTNWKLVGGVVLITAVTVAAVYELAIGPRRLVIRENPVRRRRPAFCPTPSRVQSLLFPRDRYTPSSARAWARSRGYRSAKVDVGPTYIRLRQLPPTGWARMRNVPFGKGIRAVVGWRTC